ncbi:MAG: histidine phosphatase family protein [Cyclobacteriaceae bacterium]|nr:histidine phosphatase family protein [Cyclobacteriaceae bacterium]
MARFLYLLRHAQSADKQINQSDKGRELTPSGRKDALAMGYYLLKNNSTIDIIISSPALRAHTTAGLVADALRLDPEKIIVDDELYDASVRTFLGFVNQLDDAYHHVMCVGHNPTMSYVAEYITGAEIGDMVPAGLVEIKFPGASWKEVSEGNGNLVHYIYPELLSDE